jgi:phage baseplate assembly protein W
MKGLKVPFSLDLNGQVATVTAYPDIVRNQVIDVLMTNWNERMMRPRYGADMQGSLFDGADDIVQSDLIRELGSALAQFAPRATINKMAFELDRTRPGLIWLNVSYSAGAFAEANTLRLPSNWFISEETEI